MKVAAGTPDKAAAKEVRRESENLLLTSKRVLWALWFADPPVAPSANGPYTLHHDPAKSQSKNPARVAQQPPNPRSEIPKQGEPPTAPAAPLPPGARARLLAPSLLGDCWLRVSDVGNVNEMHQKLELQPSTFELPVFGSWAEGCEVSIASELSRGVRVFRQTSLQTSAPQWVLQKGHKNPHPSWTCLHFGKHSLR